MLNNLYNNPNSMDDWIICGDFNIISYANDKKDGNQIDYTLAKLFNISVRLDKFIVLIVG